MPTDRDNRLAGAAWGGSLALHALLTASAALLVGTAPRGATDQPSREVGVVLRRERVESFAEEDTGPTSTPAAKPAETDSAAGPPLDLAVAMSPTPTESPFAELIDRLTAPDAAGESAIGIGGAREGPRKAGGSGGVGLGEIVKRGQARVTVFGVSGEGSRFVYAFDRSISMAGPPLAAAKRQLVTSLDALGDTHQFQVLFFNTGVTAFDLTGGQARVAYATDQNKRLAAEYVEAVSADGGTDRFTALKRALAYRPDVIFFLTDADIEMTPSEVHEIADRNAGVATISTIEFGRGPKPRGRNFLEDLAAVTGGAYGYIDLTRLVR
ncbi:MAG: hypothetical protein ACRCT8_12600 [Lacipirellulaceae bacterium]